MQRALPGVMQHPRSLLTRWQLCANTPIWFVSAGFTPVEALNRTATGQQTAVLLAEGRRQRGRLWDECDGAPIQAHVVLGRHVRAANPDLRRLQATHTSRWWIRAACA